MAGSIETHRDLVLSDWHVPFHDRWGMDLTLKVISIVKPTRIVIAGDALDFWGLSVFDKNPERAKDGGLQVELDIFDKVVRTIIAAVPTGCKMDYLPGNHEDRLRRFIWKNPALYGLRALSLNNLLNLDALGIEYHEDECELLSGQLVVKHGRYVSAHSAASSKRELENEKHAISTITGHVHRLGAFYARTRRGQVAGWENGCLCSLEPEYIKRPNWQHGFTLVTHGGGDAFCAQQIILLGEKKKMKTFVFGEEVRL